MRNDYILMFFHILSTIRYEVLKFVPRNEPKTNMVLIEGSCLRYGYLWRLVSPKQLTAARRRLS